MLATHLIYHLRRAWAPLTFKDEPPPERQDPVAPEVRSRSASSNAARRRGPDNSTLRPFQGLLDHLATLTRNTHVVPGTEISFDQLTRANAHPAPGFRAARARDPPAHRVATTSDEVERHSQLNEGELG